MSFNRSFQTTSAAEFRAIVAAAQTSGRLSELIQAIQERLERYQATLELHETTRDFQKIRETKRLMANLENKLEIAKKFGNRKGVS